MRGEALQADVIYSGGSTTLESHQGYEQLYGQLAYVKCLPDGLGYLSEMRLATRFFGAVALPRQGEFFTMGGPQRFRGFGLADRQGNSMWVGTLERRIPLARNSGGTLAITRSGCGTFTRPRFATSAKPTWPAIPWAG